MLHRSTLRSCLAFLLIAVVTGPWLTGCAQLGIAKVEDVDAMETRVTRANGAPPAPVDFPDLDSAATKRPTLEALSEEEPYLASYIFTNVDMDSGKEATQHAGKILAHVAKAFVDRTRAAD